MLKLAELGPVMTIFILMGISGVVSFGLVEVAKKIYKAYIAHTPEEDKEAWWWNPVLRVGAMFIGAAAGFALMNDILGASLGFASGVLNTTMVAVVKNKLKTLAPGEDE